SAAAATARGDPGACASATARGDPGACATATARGNPGATATATATATSTTAGRQSSGVCATASAAGWRPAVVKVVIPEGKTRAQIAQIAAADGLSGSYSLASRRSPLLNPVHYGAPHG